MTRNRARWPTYGLAPWRPIRRCLGRPPLQITGTFADLDGDGLLELVALTDSLTWEEVRGISAYKFIGNSMRMVNRISIPKPWTVQIPSDEPVSGGSARFIVQMANPTACGGG